MIARYRPLNLCFIIIIIAGTISCMVVVTISYLNTQSNTYLLRDYITNAFTLESQRKYIILI
jgi:hypothetical protein